MTDAEYTVLSEWFNFLITCPQLDFKIDQIVYLRTDPEVAYERIKKRKRPEEHLIPFEYLKGTFWLNNLRSENSQNKKYQNSMAFSYFNVNFLVTF